MIERRRRLLHKIHDRLLEAYGPRDWWPAESPFEMIVGAFLTQNTAWTNVEKAISALRANGLLTPEAMGATEQNALAEFIRPCGYYNQKAKKLLGFCRHIEENWGGDLPAFLAQDMDRLRDELLSIHGIGPETADSIVLYAGGHPSFVVDAYTYRIFSRHDWIAENLSYDELRDFFMDCLEP
ncbi:MAG: endonuclease III domain-containing protein, partial [Acidobacteriota bacterium]